MNPDGYPLDSVGWAGHSALPTTRHNRLFRLEAVRAGFFKAYQDQDYATIIEVAKKIPESVLQEDQKLLLWYDQALTRTGAA